MLSSRRKPGPITTGRRCCRRCRPAFPNEGTARYGARLSRGRDRFGPRQVFIQRVNVLLAASAANDMPSGGDRMTTQRLGMIMTGVTGRMGLNQHLIRSIVAIRDQGGVVLSNGDRVMPDPILVGRDAGKVE